MSAVLGVARARKTVTTLVCRLVAEGFMGEGILIVIRRDDDARDREAFARAHAPPGALADGGAAFLTTGLDGLLSDIGAAVVDDIAPIAAETALDAADIERYEAMIDDGGALVSIQVRDVDEAERARAIFFASGAEEVRAADELVDEPRFRAPARAGRLGL